MFIFLLKPDYSKLIKPARSVGFWRIKKKAFQAQSIQLGPENVRLKKLRYKDLNIALGILFSLNT